MAQNALTTINPDDAGIAAEAATKGDLAGLTPAQRTQLYGATCRSMGLNPLSQPFQYIKLNGKLTLYATRTATDQLRTINGVSITKVDKEVLDGVLTVTVHATDASGRTDMEIGAVTIGGLKGEALANAHMKALTKAKRRVTLSICGLGWLDESEVASVPSAATVVVDHNTGEITDGITPFDDLVSVCNDAGIDADMLDRWAESKGLGSHEHITDQWARKLAMTLRDSEQAERFKAQFGDTPAVEAKVSDVPPMFGDDEFAALNEEADRAVAAARARA